MTFPTQILIQLSREKLQRCFYHRVRSISLNRCVLIKNESLLITLYDYFILYRKVKIKLY